MAETMNLEDVETDDYTLISIMGVGHNGCRAVSNLYGKTIHTSLAICDAYAESLSGSPVENKVLLKQGDMTISPQDLIKLLHHKAWIKIIIAHLDNNISIQAANLLAKGAKEKAKLTIVIASMPSPMEGADKMTIAKKGYEELKGNADSIFTIDRPTDVVSVEDYFATIEKTLGEYALCLVKINTIHNLICFDGNDFKTIMKDSGDAVLAVGYGEGPHRLRIAKEEAIAHIRKRGYAPYHTKWMLVMLIYQKWNNDNMKADMDDLNDFLMKLDDKTEIKWGIIPDETLSKEMKFEIIVTEKQ